MKADISYSSVARILGQLLIVEGLLLLIPLLVEISDGQGQWAGFLIATAGALGCGYTLSRICPSRPLVIKRREGFLLVSLSWIVFSLFGMIPFLMGAHPLSLSDAFFETVSGFTTTGATTIADVEILSDALLLWRSMTQWIGGLGIILFILALLPHLNANGGIPMYNAETTGITHEKLQPRIRQTASTLWLVYIVLTIILFLLLWLGPMDLFDALCHTLTAISTGGFSTKNASIAFWNSDYVSIVLTLFMFIGGINFGLLYSLSKGRIRPLLRNDVFRWYVGIVFAAYLLTLISLLIQGSESSPSALLVKPLFHIVSDITTTGFSLSDFSAWGPFCIMITIIIMIVGACAGSTSGALKVDRVVALAKNLFNEQKRALYPKRILPVKVGGNILTRQETARIMAFISTYIALTLLGALCLSAYDWDLTDAFFASLSCIGNNGLGYGITGALGGYHMLPDAMKWLMSLLMLAGRLELFSILILFFPIFWRR